MIFTPDGIRKQEFNKSFRGFDKEEVQAFLEKLSAEFETLFNENETIKKELEETKLQLEKFLRDENKIQQTLKETEEKSNQTIEEAQHKAGEILRLADEKSVQAITNAENKAGEILRLAEEKSIEVLYKSREEADRLKSAVLNLREEKEILITKLKTVINYQAHLLEMKVEDAGEEIKEIKKLESGSSVEVDVNDIVQKLL
jgi:cell division initiation protein